MKAIEGISWLDVDEDVLQLAFHLLGPGGIPDKARADAFHIAVSAVHEMDYLMTWNCAHIANARLAPRIKKVVLEHGFQCPIICTLEELMGEDYVGLPNRRRSAQGACGNTGSVQR